MPPPPDLSSFRLSDEDSQRIFTTEILPAEFCHLPSHHAPPTPPPLAVLVVGQTGSGKTRLSPDILAAFQLARGAPPAGPVHLIADTYKTYHPEYTRLMLSTPDLASPATGPDARKWLAMASEEVVRRNLDVLLESACRHPADFVQLARLFSTAGYRVEVVLLAVPAALSRLGLLVRFYETLPEGRSRNLPLRLTPTKVHDDSYAGLLDAARFLDESSTAHQVLVVRRGNLVAYGTVDGAYGNMVYRGGVEEALKRERERPLTVPEMKTALDDIQRMSTHADASEQVEQVRSMLKPLIENSSQDGWPELKPLTFGKVGEEAGGTYNVLRLGQL
ncbi:zeta toxin family protein [Metarhizium album ARSEF 1941]|uniref:Zeta toxin family protein n=1 Tax=Metarhizium album (strain ARSEF 1941) TaxID=1081103 RepID=A0A0B2X651_METAS|nr:zeta toxin family protein [Metarhizium album ARSEF 1941]KHO00746.1 zeta toxin family protein [Metarhizium album ARSEF 1941]